MEIINDDFYQDLKRLEKEIKSLEVWKDGKYVGDVITMGDGLISFLK